MLKVLLVDDDHEEYELINSAFEKLKIPANVMQIENCTDVAGTIKRHKPDIVFMDINMPLINGIECLKSVRADQHFQHLPIIIYSTSSNLKDIHESFRHKANLYVVKPDNLRKLTASLEKVLSFDWNLKPDLPLEKFLIT